MLVILSECSEPAFCSQTITKVSDDHTSHVLVLLSPFPCLPLQVDDLIAFTKKIRAEYELSMPMFLGGHSMGSLTSIHVALRDQAAWDGLILGTATVDVEWNWFLK